MVSTSSSAVQYLWTKTPNLNYCFFSYCYFFIIIPARAFRADGVNLFFVALNQCLNTKIWVFCKVVWLLVLIHHTLSRGLASCLGPKLLFRRHNPGVSLEDFLQNLTINFSFRVYRELNSIKALSSFFHVARTSLLLLTLIKLFKKSMRIVIGRGRWCW